MSPEAWQALIALAAIGAIVWVATAPPPKPPPPPPKKKADTWRDVLGAALTGATVGAAAGPEGAIVGAIVAGGYQTWADIYG